MAAWNTLFDQARPAFSQQRPCERACMLGLSVLTGLGRPTLSGLLCAAGQQFRDWSAAYRLFERERLDGEALWPVPLGGLLDTLPPTSPGVALLDDTLLRKRGRHIAGTSWRRDPLGPHCTDNFIWASRFLQISLALPEHPEAALGAARAIPVDLLHAPSPRKPSRRADPAYLISTDPTLSPQQILQTYLWPWEIELNFRDEKTLLGFGQPQVRSDPAVPTTATFFVFVYALLRLARKNSPLAPSPLPRPRWQRLRPQRPHSRITTPQAISLLRADLWASVWNCQIKTASLRQIPAQQSRS